MKEYRKIDVMEKLEEAFEAGLNKARLLARYGLAADTPARILQGEWLHPEKVDLNQAWKEFWDKRQAFLWVLKRYHAERGRDVPAQVKMLFDTFVSRLSSTFCEDDLREAFSELVSIVEQTVTDDTQLEFVF